MACRFRSAFALLCIFALSVSARASEERLTFQRQSDGSFVAIIDGISDGPGCAPEYQPPAHCNRAASQHGHIMDRIVCTPRYDGPLAMLRPCVDEAAAAKP
jgi:hypothetical protein